MIATARIVLPSAHAYPTTLGPDCARLGPGRMRGVAPRGGNDHRGPLIAQGLPRMTGQAATCAGPREKRFTLEAREVAIDLGLGPACLRST